MRTLKLPLRHHQGYGLGKIFSKLGQVVRPLFKSAVHAARPLAKKTLKELGKAGIQTLNSTISDVVQKNVPLKMAAKKNARKGVVRAKNMLKRKAKEALDNSLSAKSKRIKGEQQSGQGFPFFSKKKRSGPLRGGKFQRKNKTKKRKSRRRPYQSIFN